MRISFLKMNGWKCLILKNAEFITEYCWIQKKKIDRNRQKKVERPKNC